MHEKQPTSLSSKNSIRECDKLLLTAIIFSSALSISGRPVSGCFFCGVHLKEALVMSMGDGAR